jgi:hypothetical protein
MRRVALILVSLACSVLASFGPLQLAHAAKGHAAIQVQSLDFYYKLDEAARFLDLKAQWQGEHRGEISIAKAKELAQAAYRESDLDTPFDRWRYHGGPSPRTFSAKAHLYSLGQKALLNVAFQVTVRAKVGNLRVIPNLQLTDYKTLQTSAHWQIVSQRTIHVPAIASGEDLLLPLMQFQLLDFLERHPNQFPVCLEVRLSNPHLGSVVKSIPLSPDHFVVPVFY